MDRLIRTRSRIGFAVALLLCGLVPGAVWSSPLVSDQIADRLKDIRKIAQKRGMADEATADKIRRMEKAFHDGFPSKSGNSRDAELSKAEKSVRDQIALVDSLLRASEVPASGDPVSQAASSSNYITAAISNLAGMEPVVRSLHDSQPSAVLVISSVICPCGKKRCDTMLGVRDALAALDPALPMAVVDEISAPSVSKTLGLTSIPSWVLLTPEGAPSSIITGFGNPDEVKASLQTWLGTNDASESTDRD